MAMMHADDVVKDRRLLKREDTPFMLDESRGVEYV